MGACAINDKMNVSYW